jgi:hypothetical protein
LQSTCTIGGSHSLDYVGKLNIHQGFPKYTVDGNNYDQYWLLNYSGSKYGGVDLSSDLGGNLVELDTGASYIYLKEFEYNSLRPYLTAIEGMSCSGLNCFNTRTCADIKNEMDSLTIYIDSVGYTVPPEGYLEDVNKNGKLCEVGIG